MGADIIRDARRDAASDMRRFGVIRTLGESGSGELPSAAVSASFEAERRRSGFFRTVAVESAGSAVFERPDVDIRRTTLRRTEPLRFESADEDRISASNTRRASVHFENTRRWEAVAGQLHTTDEVRLSYLS